MKIYRCPNPAIYSIKDRFVCEIHANVFREFSKDAPLGILKTKSVPCTCCKYPLLSEPQSKAIEVIEDLVKNATPSQLSYLSSIIEDIHIDISELIELAETEDK